MYIAFISCLLISGLFFFGMAIYRLWLLDWMQANAPIPQEDQENGESTEDGPKLTKLGRPVTEIRLSA